MKIIEHMCGGVKFLIYEIELDSRHVLIISPAAVDSGKPGAVYTMKVVRDGRQRHEAVAIPKGKMEEIRKAMAVAIRDVEKRGLNEAEGVGYSTWPRKKELDK